MSMAGGESKVDKINFNYTGLALNEYGWWYVEGGKINFNHTGLVGK